MIIGIGTDLIEVKRVKKACEKHAFFTRCFSVEEQQLIGSNMLKAASNWAGKESVGKMFGTGISGFELKDIEILRDKKGKPFVVLHRNAEKISKELGIVKIHITLTNTEDYAVAFVVGEGENHEVFTK